MVRQTNDLRRNDKTAILRLRRRIVTLLIIAAYKYSYLLTCLLAYLLTYLLTYLLYVLNVCYYCSLQTTLCELPARLC